MSTTETINMTIAEVVYGLGYDAGQVATMISGEITDCGVAAVEGMNASEFLNEVRNRKAFAQGFLDGRMGYTNGLAVDSCSSEG